LLVPLLILGLLMSGVTYFLNEGLVPWGMTRYERIKETLVNQRDNPHLETDVFFKGEQNRYFHIKEFDNQTHRLDYILIYDLQDKKMVTARKGRAKGKIIYLRDGIISDLEDDGYLKQQSNFEAKTVNLERDLNQLMQQQKQSSELNRSELKRRIKVFKQSGLDATKLVVEYHFKLAQSLACLIFVLIGAPLSVKSEHGRIMGVIISVAIIFIYYILLSLSKSLGKNGLLIPFLAAWLPNLIFVLLGSYLIIREDKVIS
ncbi:MAG: LptF/LptG family permease, partial [Bacillota bacterium]